MYCTSVSSVAMFENKDHRNMCFLIQPLQGVHVQDTPMMHRAQTVILLALLCNPDIDLHEGRYVKDTAE